MKTALNREGINGGKVFQIDIVFIALGSISMASKEICHM